MRQAGATLGPAAPSRVLSVLKVSGLYRRQKKVKTRVLHLFSHHNTQFSFASLMVIATFDRFSTKNTLKPGVMEEILPLKQNPCIND